MKELIRGVACLALALGATACEDDPSIDFGGSPTTVQLSPNVMFITSGNTKELLVRLVNDRNQAVPTSFTVSNVGAGLNVVFDTAFRPQQTIADPVLTSPLIKTQQRYFIEADLPGGGQRTFTLTSSGISGSPTINVEPSNTGALSATAPALGEAVTITAPDAQTFTTTPTSAASTVFFVVGADTLRPVITELTSTSISFLPLPGSAGPAFVTGITLNFAPTLAPRRLETPNEIMVAPTDTLALVIDNSTPAIGDPVVVTAPANFAFTQTATVSVGGALAVVTNRAVDGTTITFIPIPGSTGNVRVSALTFLPEPLLPTVFMYSGTELTVPAVTNIPLVYSTGTPAAGAAVSVTAAGFRFRPNAVFSYTTGNAFVLSISADSTTASILPPPNMAAETAEVSNVSLASLPAVGLVDIPSTATMTTTAYPPAPAGGATIVGAPLITAIAPGQGVAYTESGTLNFGPDIDFLGGGNSGAPRYYQLDIAVAGTYNIRMSWNLGGDMDLYLRNSTNTATIEQSPTGANPESVTATLAVGTYFVVLHNWQNLGPVPTEVLITVK